MACAPHTNTDVQSQLSKGVPNPLPIIFGQFKECEHGNLFEYAERRWFDDSVNPELPHIIYVGNGETRLAIVKKTVAFVLVDENKIERWEIKSHRIYDTTWVRP